LLCKGIDSFLFLQYPLPFLRFGGFHVEDG
jgi:hypothetical protein